MIKLLVTLTLKCNVSSDFSVICHMVMSLFCAWCV